MKVSNATRADVSHLFWPVTVAAIVVGADRILKQLTPALLERGTAWPGAEWPLRIVHVVNTGAAFGTLKGQTDLLAIVSALGIILFTYLLFRSQSGATHRLGLSLALGGAVANFVDRATSGEVIDSIKVEFWPAFNLADVALTCGIALVLWSAMRTDTAHAEGSAPAEGQGLR